MKPVVRTVTTVRTALAALNVTRATSYPITLVLLPVRHALTALSEFVNHAPRIALIVHLLLNALPAIVASCSTMELV